MSQKTIGDEYGLFEEERKKGRNGARSKLVAIVVGITVIAIIGVVLAMLLANGRASSWNLDSKASAASADEVVSRLSAKVTGTSIIAISEYSSGGFSTSIHCLVDSSPIYCDGGPVLIQGFPPGKYTFSVSEGSKTSSLEFQVS
jgi:hypothetical protein